MDEFTGKEGTIISFKHESWIPDKPEDIKNFILINTEKIKFVSNQIKTLDKLGIAKEVLEQKKKELKQISMLVVEAEIKIAELLTDLKKEKSSYDFNITARQKTRCFKLMNYKGSIEEIVDKLLIKNNIPSTSNIFEMLQKNDIKYSQVRKYSTIKLKTDYKPKIFKWVLKTFEKYLETAKENEYRENLIICIQAIRNILGIKN